MYSMSEACIKSRGMLSESFTCGLGVRQGDVLSPLLFNIYVNDLPECFGNDSNTPVLDEMPVSCLMYADDLVIFSLSEQGMQSKLNQLGEYCKKWFLNINVKKSKYLVLRSNRSVATGLTLLGKKLEQVSCYIYLGIEISDNGTMKSAQVNIKNRALKAVFKLRKLLRESHIRPTLSLKLFDQMIKPICLYGSEIWANPTYRNDQCPNNNKIWTSLEKLPVEKLYIRYCKFTLGVHSKASNYAVLGELGRYPLYIDVIVHMFNFYLHMKGGESNNCFLQHALNESVKMFKNNGKSWLTLLSHICATLHLPSIEYFTKRDVGTLKKTLRKKFDEIWLSTLNKPKSSSSGKLSTYRTFKSSINFENYLSDIKERRHAIALCKFRISAHRLKIETGRYFKTPREKRLCDYCKLSNQDVIEDEVHALLVCAKYNAARNEMINKVCRLCPIFTSLSNEQKFIYLMTAEKQIAEAVAKMCYNILYVI